MFSMYRRSATSGARRVILHMDILTIRIIIVNVRVIQIHLFCMVKYIKTMLQTHFVALLYTFSCKI